MALLTHCNLQDSDQLYYRLRFCCRARQRNPLMPCTKKQDRVIVLRQDTEKNNKIVIYFIDSYIFVVIGTLRTEAAKRLK